MSKDDKPPTRVSSPVMVCAFRVNRSLPIVPHQDKGPPVTGVGVTVFHMAHGPFQAFGFAVVLEFPVKLFHQ